MPSKIALRRQRAARKTLAANPTDFEALRHSIVITSRAARIARILAAREMGLLDDPEGKTLPYNLWITKLSEAQTILKEGRVVITARPNSEV